MRKVSNYKWLVLIKLKLSVKIKTSYKDVEKELLSFLSLFTKHGLRATLIFLTLN